MSNLLASYVADAEQLLAAVRPRVDALDASPSTRSDASRALEEPFAQLDSLVRLVDIELRRPDSAPAETQARARACVAEARSLKERKSKGDLVATEGAEGSDTRRYHSRYKNTTARLESSSELLLESRRNVLETESVAVGIAEKLLENRATMESSRDKLLETGGLMGRAHRAMRSMQKRETQRKLALFGAVGFVILLLLWAVVSLFAGGGGSSPPTPTPAPTLRPVNQTR
jgi:hypothetical protein